MKSTLKKNILTQKRRWRIRKKVIGTAGRPRLVVKFTHLHIYAQVIDDEAGRTLAAWSTTEKTVREQKIKSYAAGADAFGKAFGDKAKAAGISAVVFDRAGRRYHGVVKAFADAVRAAGIQF